MGLAITRISLLLAAVRVLEMDDQTVDDHLVKGKLTASGLVAWIHRAW